MCVLWLKLILTVISFCYIYIIYVIILNGSDVSLFGIVFLFQSEMISVLQRKKFHQIRFECGFIKNILELRHLKERRRNSFWNFNSTFKKARGGSWIKSKLRFVSFPLLSFWDVISLRWTIFVYVYAPDALFIVH